MSKMESFLFTGNIALCKASECNKKINVSIEHELCPMSGKKGYRGRKRGRRRGRGGGGGGNLKLKFLSAVVKLRQSHAKSIFTGITASNNGTIHGRGNIELRSALNVVLTVSRNLKVVVSASHSSECDEVLHTHGRHTGTRCK